jgi:hypothetical protein
MAERILVDNPKTTVGGEQSSPPTVVLGYR